MPNPVDDMYKVRAESLQGKLHLSALASEGPQIADRARQLPGRHAG